MSKVEEILESNLYCTIATVCKDGSPWSTPLFFAKKNKNIYWWSPIKSVHSQNILRDGKVFITVFDSTLQEGKGEGVYLESTAKILEDEKEVEEAITIFNKKANVFKLSTHNTLGGAPTRLFVATFNKAWINKDSEENGYFIDVREQIL